MVLIRVLTPVVMLLYALLVPPFQVPDENQHFYKAYALSQLQILAVEQDGTTGAFLPRAVVAFAEDEYPREKTGESRIYSLAQVQASWQRPFDSGDRIFVPFPNMASYAPTLYAFQALGLATGRWLGLPLIGMFFLGRIFNAAFATALILLATRRKDGLSVPILTVAVLPTVTYHLASFSADAAIISLGLAMFAWSWRRANASLAGSPAVLGLVGATALTLAKGIYGPITLAGLTFRRKTMRSDALIVGCFVLSVAAFAGWMALAGGTQVPYQVVSRKTEILEWTANPRDQLAFLLAAPLAYVRVLVTSFAERSPVYVLQIFGRFGWNAFLLPMITYLIGIVALGLTLVHGRAPEGLTVLRRVWLLVLVAGIGVLVETALYLTGTPFGADYIQGTQGRYFLPILPMLLVAGAMVFDPGSAVVGFARRALPACCILLMALGVFTVVISFWVTGFHHASGFPPFDRSIPGLIRMLLLPSGSWT